MPSPIGHALAGWATARVFQATFGAEGGGSTAGTIALAVVADADIFPGLRKADPNADHKKGTHSLGAAVLAGLAAGCGGRLRGHPFLPNAGRGGVAYASHLLLDGFSEGSEGGMRLLWPFSRRARRVPGVWFRAIRSESAARGFWKGMLLSGNLRAVGREVATLLPAVLAARPLGRWLRRSVLRRRRPA